MPFHGYMYVQYLPGLLHACAEFTSVPTLLECTVLTSLFILKFPLIQSVRPCV
jgi:hypothetical protein